jgi:hypothetical protein
MYFDKYVQEFDLKDKTLDENFKKNALGTVGLSILEMVKEGNFIKIESAEGKEVEVEDLIDVQVEDEEGNKKTLKEKGKKKVYRLIISMTKVPKKAIKKNSSCTNPFNAGARKTFNPKG